MTFRAAIRQNINYGGMVSRFHARSISCRESRRSNANVVRIENREKEYQWGLLYSPHDLFEEREKWKRLK